MRTLKEARKEKGLTQNQLAKLVGRCDQTIRDYEKGSYNIGPATRIKLVEILGEFED